ncbi:MAG TPA: A/G-specific adenine glycosylase [Rhizobiaceae bacterium]|nr:A/G-specific adenine glycosylase [Rhizobiaceae bacterium]
MDAPDKPFPVEELLFWYDRNARQLAWRVGPRDTLRGVRPDPYRVWLSEIMLQQTTVAAVGRFFAEFTQRWPGVQALAAASEDDVLKAWAGLGYYSRARNLKACAEVVVAGHGGIFPQSAARLRRLPGIGEYTSAAIAAIAFGEAVAVVDGNVERVIARHAAIAVPVMQAKGLIRRIVAQAVPGARPGDFAQAMMDLGATICTPRKPVCALCPVNSGCAAFRAGDPLAYPLKAQKAPKPQRKGAAYIAVAPNGAILLRKRPPRGLLAAMAEPPGSGWTARNDGETDARAAPFCAQWRKAGVIGHVFTHFELKLEVWRADIPTSTAPPGCWWSQPAELGGEALPSVMKKAIACAVPDAFSVPPSRRQQGSTE